MIFKLDDLYGMDDFEDFTGIFRIFISDFFYDDYVPYLEWKHRDQEKWIHEFEVIKGIINSQRYAKYDKEGNFVESFNLS